MWIINITDKVGLTCYDVIDIMDVVDMEDTYNVMAGTFDLYLAKEYCTVTNNTIIYKTNDLDVLIEKC